MRLLRSDDRGGQGVPEEVRRWSMGRDTLCGGCAIYLYDWRDGVPRLIRQPVCATASSISTAAGADAWHHRKTCGIRCLTASSNTLPRDATNISDSVRPRGEQFGTASTGCLANRRPSPSHLTVLTNGATCGRVARKVRTPWSCTVNRIVAEPSDSNTPSDRRPRTCDD